MNKTLETCMNPDNIYDKWLSNTCSADHLVTIAMYYSLFCSS